MKAVFRVDSGKYIGNGHLIRCLNIAKYFYKRDYQITFISRNHNGHSYDLIDKKFNLMLLTDAEHSHSKECSTWLGVGTDIEVEMLNKSVSALTKDDVLFIDHYGIDHQIQKKLKCIAKIVVIDDLMNRKHYCDFLIDHNLSAFEKKYNSLMIKTNTKLLLGSKYCMINEEFSKNRRTSLHFPVMNIMVFFSLSDTTQEVLKVLDAYEKLENKPNLHIVLSSKSISYSKVLSLKTRYNTIHSYEYIKDMPTFLDNIDICFGASGISVWERAIVGIPSFLITISDNQRKVIKSLAEKKIVHYVGDTLKTTIDSWSEAFLMTQSEEKLEELFLNSTMFCKGSGIKEILNEIESA